MNNLTAKAVDTARKNETDAPTRGRAWLSMFVFFLAGAVLSGAWFSRNAWIRSAHSGAGAGDEGRVLALSGATETLLRHLKAPVEIRFYSLLDPAGASDSLQVFSGRVDQLLALYEQAGGGKLTISRSRIPSTSSADAASADGIKPFALDKGDGSYLGIAVVCVKQKELLPTLAPEWEQALEPDLTRAIARAVDGGTPAPVAPRADAATLDSVKRMIPNIESVSVEEGTRTIRQASLAEFKKAVQEMQAKVKEAESRFLQAQADQSAAGQEAARKEIAQIEAEQRVKVQQVTGSMQAQISALQQIKAASN